MKKAPHPSPAEKDLDEVVEGYIDDLPKKDTSKTEPIVLQRKSIVLQRKSKKLIVLPAPPPPGPPPGYRGETSIFLSEKPTKPTVILGKPIEEPIIDTEQLEEPAKSTTPPKKPVEKPTEEPVIDLVDEIPEDSVETASIEIDIPEEDNIKPEDSVETASIEIDIPEEKEEDNIKPEDSVETASIEIDIPEEKPLSRDELRELKSELQKGAYKTMNGVVRDFRPLSNKLLATVVVNTDFLQMSDELNEKEVERIANIRDGLYLVLSGKSEFITFGGDQAGNIMPATIGDHYENIQNEEDFCKKSKIAEQELKGSQEELGGAIVKRKEIEDGSIIQIMDGETLFLIFKDEKGDTIKLGGDHASDAPPSQIEMYYDAIQSKEEFDYFNQEIEQELALKKLKEEMEEMGGTVIQSKNIEGGLVLIIEDEDGNLILISKGNEHGQLTFGGKYAKAISQEEIMEYYNQIQSEKDFREGSFAIEQREKLKAVETNLKKQGGSIIDCKTVEGGLLAKVLLPGPIETTLCLMLINGDVKVFGKDKADRITPEEIETYFGITITAGEFEINSEMFEGIRSSPKS